MFGIRIVLKAKKQTLKVSSCEEPKRLHWILLLSTAVTEPLHCNNPACTSIKQTLFNVAYIFFPGICSCGFHFRFNINGWMRRTHGNKDDVLLIQIKLWNPNQEGFWTGGQWGWSEGTYVEWRFCIQVNTNALASRATWKDLFHLDLVRWRIESMTSKMNYGLILFFCLLHSNKLQKCFHTWGFIQSTFFYLCSGFRCFFTWFMAMERALCKNYPILNLKQQHLYSTNDFRNTYNSRPLTWLTLPSMCVLT